MKALKHWKVIVALVLVFGAGGVAGSVWTTLHVKRAFERALKPENWTADAMKHLQRDLQLSPEQQPRIRAILDETVQQFKGSFGQAIRESGTNMVASWRRIDQELTPEQRAIHHQKCDQFRKGLRESLKIELPPE